MATRESRLKPGTVTRRMLASDWVDQAAQSQTLVRTLLSSSEEAQSVGDAGLGYDSPSTAIVTPPAGAWGPLSWNLPGAGGGAPLSFLRNSITEWPTSGPPWSEIRPYLPGVYRVSCSVWGPTNAPPQVWAATEWELAVFLNGTLFRILASVPIQVAATVPVQTTVGVCGTSLVPIDAPQDPEDPVTPGDIITFQIRTTSGTAQTLVGGEVVVDVDFVGPFSWTMD